MKYKTDSNDERKRKSSETISGPVKKKSNDATDSENEKSKGNEGDLKFKKDKTLLTDRENSPRINNNERNGKENITEPKESSDETEKKSSQPETLTSLDPPDEKSDNPYDSMVKSFTNRGKGKRQVRLVESHLVQFVFGDMDSEDDEDFVLDAKSMNSDDSCDGSVDDDSKSDNDDDDDDTSDERSDKSSDTENEENVKLEQEQSNVNEPILENIKGESTETEITSKPVFQKRTILVCGVCLESRQSDSDEILECDNCGITVHEGCYGEINFDIEDDKSDSDAPTEPWFCELCKANMANTPFCELCPNIGGIYKQTDTGKWVHLVCALYTPDVGYRDVSRFQAVVLEDIRNNAWGTRDCQICSNEDFSRTGVCICCDSGLCKTTFHVTCAQRNGFLSDIPDRNDGDDCDAPDVLYAHCKMHSVRQDLKKRKASWTAFQSHISKFQRNEIDKERIDTALIYARKKYADFRMTVPIAKLSEEQPRLLSSCPEACIMLARKAEMLGVSLNRDYNFSAAVVSGKLSKFELNFTPEYVKYFFKRETDIQDLKNSFLTFDPTLNKLRNTQKHLTNESQVLQEKLDSIIHIKENLEQSHITLHKTLSQLAGKTLSSPSFIAKRQKNKQNDRLNATTHLLSSVVNKCATCRSIEDQDLLARCGTCRKYYHLACVDPPLSRMPKSSGTYVWQCTECDSSDESSEADDSKTKRVRTKKEPEKFVPGERKDMEDSKMTKMKHRKKSSDHKKQTKKSISNEDINKSDSGKPQSDKQSNYRKRKKKIKSKAKIDFTGTCTICSENGNSTSLVQCDTCKQFYHFKTCLDPPCSQSPKSKFYGWECEKCNDSSENE